MKEFKITLDLIKPTKSEEAINLKEKDLSSVKFIFEVLSDGELYDLTGATSVTLAVQRQSGFAVSQLCTVTEAEKGTCEIVLSAPLYSEIGLNVGELQIIKDGTTVITRQFEFRTLKAIDI